MADLFRIYDATGADGYPPEWHETIKDLVREQAGHRCVRCGHPYSKGDGQWSKCDEFCTHAGPIRWATFLGDTSWSYTDGDEENRRLSGELWPPGSLVQTTLAAVRPYPLGKVEAEWRILTVHHLNGDKLDCRWWNLASLCQRCHLRIQRTVVMPRVFPWEHTDWFKPYAAGWYAFAYLGEELSREETMARLDELLALERAA